MSQSKRVVTASNVIGVLVSENGAIYAIVADRREMTCDLVKLSESSMTWRPATPQDLDASRDDLCVWLRPVVERVRPADLLIQRQ